MNNTQRPTDVLPRGQLVITPGLEHVFVCRHRLQLTTAIVTCHSGITSVALCPARNACWVG
jgi:hypothetical protein